MTLNPDFGFYAKEGYRIFYAGAKEIIGPDEARDVFMESLRQAGCVPNLRTLQYALDQRYGESCGHGISQRIGQAVFQQALRTWGSPSGLNSPDYRFLPFSQRVDRGLALSADLYARITANQVDVLDAGDHWLWQVKPSPAACEPDNLPPSCCLVIGLLQGFMTWAGGGRAFHVRETDCTGTGAATCRFEIAKAALD